MSDPLARRAYDALLVAYPREFRRQHAQDMCDYFVDELAHARRRGMLAAVVFWLRALADVVVHGALARYERVPVRLVDSRGLPAISQRSSSMDVLLQDVRFALRSLIKRPGFTAIAVTTLAIGIGANSAMFALVRAVLLQPLPYRDSGQLVRVTGATRDQPGPVSNLSRPDFKDFARDNRSFESMGAFGAGIGSFAIVEGEPERVRAVNVSGDFFRVLEAIPETGRLLTMADETSGADVIVISHGLWRRRFGADPGVVGRTLQLSAGPQVILGVLPEGFRYPQPDALGEPDIYAPMVFTPQFGRSGRSIRAIARLRPGVSAARAESDLIGLATHLEELHPEDNYHESVRVEPLLDAVVGSARTTLLMLFGAVGSVLLVACVNITNLLLARGASRAKELAIRTALGAGHGRIVRQLLTETLVLTVAGGAAGMLFGWAMLRVVLAVAAGSIPRADGVALDPLVLGFAIGVSILCGVCVGLIASSQVSRVNVSAGLGDGGRGGSTAALSGRLRGVLIAAEVAASFVLVIAAALLLQSLWRLSSVSPGFTREPIVAFDVALSLGRYAEGAQIPFYDDLYQRIARLPGVRGVAGTNILPLSGGYSCDGFRVDRHPVPRGQEPCAEARSVSGGYFAVMSIPVIAGRSFDETDRSRSRPVVVINEAMARTFWPGEDPVGQTMTYLAREDTLGPREIVGVVGDTKHLALAETPRPMFYTPQSQPPSFHAMTVVVRSDGDRAALVSAMRGELKQMDVTLPLHNARTLDEILGRAIAEPRFRTILLGMFAVAALGLALMGIYGVIVYTVAQRTREIGIRIALGARRRSVVRTIVGQALAPVLWGIGVGFVVSAAVNQVLANLLFGISPADVRTLVSVPLLVLAVSAVASLIPALQASRVDPIAAMRRD